MERMPHCLIVEDDREIGALMSRFLSKHGFRISVAPDGRAMQCILADSAVDILVLDLMLPGESGLELCRRLRSTSNVPVIMLTALAEEMDRIIGLEMGADDYLAKPFNQRELLARIRAVLRRASSLPYDARARVAGVMTFAGWKVDPSRRQLQAPDGMHVVLTSGEFDLLVAFCQHPQRVLSRDQLLDLTVGRAAEAFDRSIDVRISRLRRKIEQDAKIPQIITTVRSGGYLFAAVVTVT
jgi:two-component system, OmpR family, response regulator